MEAKEVAALMFLFLGFSKSLRLGVDLDLCLFFRTVPVECPLYLFVSGSLDMVTDYAGTALHFFFNQFVFKFDLEQLLKKVFDNSYFNTALIIWQKEKFVSIIPKVIHMKNLNNFEPDTVELIIQNYYATTALYLHAVHTNPKRYKKISLTYE